VAHRHAAILGQLYAVAGSARIITANGLFFERYHAGRTSVDRRSIG